MSTRQLRKLQKQRELEEVKSVLNEKDEDSGESEAELAPAAKPRVSLFAALGGEDEEEDDVGKDVDSEEDQGKSQQRLEDAQAAEPSKKSKKKKKKKKSKAKAAAAVGEVAEEEEEEEDEIDKAIKALNIGTQKGDGRETAGTSAGVRNRLNDLLSINTYNLKAINEMRNLFGREVIESANAEEQEQTRQRRRAMPRQVDLETFLRGPPGMKRLPEVSLRRNVFIQGREHWPLQTAGGLTMKQLEKAPDGSWTEYAYIHDTQYDAVQSFFFSCVQIGDPSRMIYLLQQVPYHVSTLLQVSSLAKQDQNMSLAAELCERALFTFGRVATSAFRQDIENGRARLDFRRPENRQLWLAGYHYLKSLIRKGTYKTALEWTKLLFSFDQKDPYAMRHYLHVLAIRAHESEWLVDFMDELERTSDNRDTIYLRQSLVLGKLQMKDIEGARKELEIGIKRVPWLYCALFQELGLDAPPSIWGMNAESDTRSFWVKLYIYQTKDLWNNAQATGLLQEVAKSLSKVDTSSLPADDPAADLGVTRLAYLEGQTSLLSVAPRDLLDSQPNYEFDPLPPSEHENIFTGAGCRLPWLHGSRGSRAMESEIEAQLQNVMARQAARAQQRGAGAVAAGPGAGVGALGNFGIGGDDDDFFDEEALAIDDEELRRDIEEHARRSNAPGIIETLIQMLRGGNGEAAAQQQQEGGSGADTDEDDDAVPGAWPGDNR